MTDLKYIMLSITGFLILNTKELEFNEELGYGMIVTFLTILVIKNIFMKVKKNA